MVTWLKKPVSVKGLFVLVMAAVVVMLGWEAFVFLKLMPWLHLKPAALDEALETQIHNLNPFVGLALGVSALAEEVLFRFIPLQLAAEKKPSNDALVVFMAIASSILFGLARGFYGTPIKFQFSAGLILVQVVVGLVLSAIFLKAGNFGKNPLRGLAASWLAHGCLNGSLVIADLIFG
jgi:hypothetical protein